ncbi:MAG: nitroreductase [Elusimicrobia bacterium RIFOXYA2_FULL_40_6]|nr:MAG: nitroreductase [Elusimicrobia bacterium RIFOXYA2_FULL_40_6]
MKVMEAIKNRRSVRKYQNKPIEKEKMNLILEAARLAPSARNRQEWQFVVAQNKQTIEKLSVAANNQAFIAQAAAVIACCGINDGYIMRCGQPATPIDLAIAIDHMTLKAQEEGIGTCWIGSFFQDQVKMLLGIPEDIPVIELLALGYPAENPEPRNRKNLEEIVHWEKW